MKVSPEHQSLIRSAIVATGLDNEMWRERYRAREIPRGYQVVNIDKRYRWDLFHAANRATVDMTTNTMLLSTLYDAGYNDSHIDTALRQIVEAL